VTPTHRQNREYIEGTITYVDPDAEQTQDQRPSFLLLVLLCQRFHWRRLRSILLLSLFIIVFLLGSQYAVFSLSTATVYVSPEASVREANIVVIAMTNPKQATQSRARLLSARRSSPPVSVQASGMLNRAATHAVGTLTWYNQALSAQTIPAGTIVTAHNGGRIITNSTVIIPSGAPPDVGEVSGPAHALQAGASSNIAPLAINNICPCEAITSMGIAIKNLSAFDGGQDDRHLPFVQQSDLERAVASQKESLTRQVLQNIRHQVRVYEQLVAPASCVQHVWSTFPVGSLTTQTQVSLTVDCTAEVFDVHEVYSKALLLFMRQQAPLLSTRYILGWHRAYLIGRTRENKSLGTLLLDVRVSGEWLYRLDHPALQALQNKIAGVSLQQAHIVLARTPGVSKTTIQVICPWLPLPTDPRRIRIVIWETTSTTG